MIILTEDKKQELINKAKNGAAYKGDQSKGKNRYFRRVHSKISSSVSEYNAIDMNKFFQSQILDVSIKVHGETNDYLVRISFGQLIDKIQEGVKANNGKFEFKIVVKALIKCFNTDDVYIRCDCPDWQYRLGYYASVNHIIVGDEEDRPSDITNPDDTLGPACKHVCCVLQNSSWIYKVAATINNYVNYMESHYKAAYAGVIYPAIYGAEYTGELKDVSGPVKAGTNLGTDSDAIDRSNKYGATRGRFQKVSTPEPPDEEDI